MGKQTTKTRKNILRVLAPSWQFHRGPSFQESHNVRFYFHGCYVLPEQLGKSLNHRQTRDFGMDKNEPNNIVLSASSLSQKRPMSGWPSLALYPGAVCVCVAPVSFFFFFSLCNNTPNQFPKIVNMSLSFFFILFLSLLPKTRNQRPTISVNSRDRPYRVVFSFSFFFLRG